MLLFAECCDAYGTHCFLGKKVGVEVQLLFWKEEMGGRRERRGRKEEGRREEREKKEEIEKIKGRMSGREGQERRKQGNN